MVVSYFCILERRWPLSVTHLLLLLFLLQFHYACSNKTQKRENSGIESLLATCSIPSISPPSITIKIHLPADTDQDRCDSYADGSYFLIRPVNEEQQRKTVYCYDPKTLIFSLENIETAAYEIQIKIPGLESKTFNTNIELQYKSVSSGPLCLEYTLYDIIGEHRFETFLDYE